MRNSWTRSARPVGRSSATSARWRRASTASGGPARFKLPLVHLVGRAHVVAVLRNEPNDLLLVAVLRWSEAAGVFVVDNVVRLAAEIHVYDAFVEDGGRPEALGLVGSDFFGLFNVLARLRLHATAGGCPRLELLETMRFPRMLVAPALDGHSLFGFQLPSDGRLRDGRRARRVLPPHGRLLRPPDQQRGGRAGLRVRRSPPLAPGGRPVAPDALRTAQSGGLPGADGGVLIVQDEEGFFYRFPVTSPDSLCNSCWTAVSRLTDGHSDALSFI
ncbi:hypothetical protein M3Y99_00818700 [Aphelenchoides fujianensis]|nr:hypothetical protein M3Y99_00818700 [Aphelenchoides fujianensis]